MNMKTITPTELRKDIYKTFKDITNNDTELEVRSNRVKQTDDSLIVMSKKRYDTLNELAYLANTGTLDAVMERMDNEKDGDFDEKDAL